MSQYARIVNETPIEAAWNIYAKIRTTGSAEVRSPLKAERNTNAQMALHPVQEATVQV
jgi:hypothetical protein